MDTVLTSNPLARATIVAVPVLLLGLFIAVNISTTFVPVLFLLGLIAITLLQLFCRNVRVEAVVVALLITGYMIGNRGFAQISIVQPLFLGELGLMLCAFVLMLRFALTREAIELQTGLARTIAFFLLIGIVHFLFDRRSFPVIDVIRDFAIVYYAGFYFAAFQSSIAPRSRTFIANVIQLAIIGHAVIAVLLVVRPGWLMVPVIRSIPILAQKEDLTATFSVLSIFILFLRRRVLGSVWARRFLICVLAATVLAGISRSALLALVVTSTLIWIARKRNFFGYWLVLAGAGATLLLVIEFGFSNSEWRPVIHQFNEKLQSMTDFSGSAKYQTELGQYKADDNEFRRTFWKTMISQTTRTSPIFGKGFGYDFLPEFERIYGRGTWERLRSPHNYFITVYGRLGMVGLVGFVAIVWFMIRGALRASILVSRRKLDNETLGYWCAAWVLLISGTFGVVLEGPMGGVLFWSFLGLAASGLYAADQARVRSGSAVRTEHLPTSHQHAATL